MRLIQLKMSKIQVTWKIICLIKASFAIRSPHKQMRLNVFMIILKLAKSQTKLEQSNEACLALNESDFVQLPYIKRFGGFVW